MIQISSKNKFCFTESRHVAVLATAMALSQASTAFAAPPEIIVPNLQQQGIPSIRREEVIPKKEATEKEVGPATGPELADQILPAKIRQIDLQSPLFPEEINALLSPFLGKDRVSGKALEQARGQIWELYRQHGRMVRVELRAIAGSEAAGGSILQAQIREISVRAVRVEQAGDAVLKQSLLDDILASTKADIAEGGVLDLNRLDSRIKRRMFLKDVSIHATLVPVGPDHVDVNVQVRAAPVEPLALLAQYDNDGMRAYGRNRYTVGLSIPGRLLPGDQIDILALASSGMTFAHVGYEFPLTSIGARMNVWGSNVDYRVPSITNGYTTLVGAGLNYPLYIGNTSILMGSLNYVNRHEADNLADNTPTANKTTNSLQGVVDASYFLSPAQSLHFRTALTFGELDLSSLPIAKLIDSITTKTNGGFTKFELSGGWNTLFGPGGKLDSRLEARAQLASKNLDQSEKLALGGPLGVRAYGPAEALGDEGYVANAEIGYQPITGLRAFAFYDIGRIRQYKQSWGVQTTPSEYTLQGAGVGLAYIYKSVIGSATYARQIGSNPGLSPAGLDSDGLRDRYRLWLSLTLRL